MRRWADKLFIYEINTWVWLNKLSQQYGKKITLDNVPDEALDRLDKPNVDFIWLMGVWKRSEFARKNALKYMHEYVGALPDLTEDDVIGSAYSIADYQVDERIGGREGLAKLRARLKERNLGLILDYVPNHVAVDHPWVHEHPDYIIMGKPKDARERQSDFFRHKDKRGKTVVLAHGRDPYFPGWSDTAQLNAFNPALRDAVTETLKDIAQQCDGVRCDMAMLMMNEIFGGTWEGYVLGVPETDYWPTIIPPIKEAHPEFMFIAEAYWNKEAQILQQGFNFVYDKTFYDRVMEDDVQHLRDHLVASIDYQKHMVRFLENHDEPRAYDRLGPEKSFPAATLICTLPGACLLHQGQFQGYLVKLPVQISRAPVEEDHADLYDHYLKLLKETRDPIYQNGQWYLFDLNSAGEDDETYFNLLAYGWRDEAKGNYRLMVVNITPMASYARLPLGFWGELAGSRWILHDVGDGATYERDGDEMTGEGLFIELKPFESHIFRFQRASQAETETASAR
mgnify:CR=1 FL=1